MAWNPVRVRRAVDGDLETLLDLAGEMRGQVLPMESGRIRGAAGRQALADRYRQVLADPSCEVALAVCGHAGEPEVVLGMALLSLTRTNPLVDRSAVLISHTVVSSAHRRRGAGRALVSRATAFAEEHGLDDVVVSLHPGARDGARFFARLGFAPLTVRRTAPVPVIRRKLAALDRAPEPLVRRSRRISAMPVRPRALDSSGS